MLNTQAEVFAKETASGNSNKADTSLLALNDMLIQQIERLTDDTLSKEDLDREIKRSEAFQKLAKSVIDNGNLVLNAQKFQAHCMENMAAVEPAVFPLLNSPRKK